MFQLTTKNQTVVKSFRTEIASMLAVLDLRPSAKNNLFVRHTAKRPRSAATAYRYEEQKLIADSQHIV